MLRRLHRPLRFSLFLSTLVAASALSQAALETPVWAAEKANVAVGGFDGAKSDEVRAAFIESLKKDGHYEVTDAEDVKANAKGKAIAEAAKGLAVSYVIVGKVGKGFNLKLKVMKADGKVIDEVEIKGGALPKLKSSIESSGAASVADALGQPKPKAEEKAAPEEAPAAAADDEKKDEEKPAEASAEISTDNAGGGGLSPLDLTAGLRPLHRTFTFHQTLADVRPNGGFSQLLKYELPLGPVLFIDANIWVGSLAGMQGPAEWIGLTAGFEKGFATQSVYAEGTPAETTLRTNIQQLYVGGRFRLPIGDHLLGASGVWGQHRFILEGDEGTTKKLPNGDFLGPLVPDVTYNYVRVMLDGNFRFGDFSAGAHVGKRFVMSPGAIKTVWFPNVKTSSLEAGVTFGYRLVSMLDLVAGFDWLRYSFDFNPVKQIVDPARPGLASYVAGGATDEYLSGYIGFRFHLPGKGEKAAEAAAAGQ